MAIRSDWIANEITFLLNIGRIVLQYVLLDKTLKQRSYFNVLSNQLSVLYECRLEEGISSCYAIQTVDHCNDLCFNVLSINSKFYKTWK